MVENAVEHVYLSGIHSPTLGFGARTLQDVFLFLYQTYGRISPATLKQNTEKLTSPISPHLPINLIFRQIEDCQRLATAAGAPFTAEQIIKAAENVVLATGKYQWAYREWISLPAAQKTFNNFRKRFTQEYQVQNEITGVTADAQGFAGEVTETPELNEAMANFAQALAADRNAFAQLTETNANLQHHINNVTSQNENLNFQLNQLQNQIKMMNLAQQPTLPTPQNIPPPGNPTLSNPVPPQATMQQQQTPYGYRNNMQPGLIGA